jgi:hypothetical protein
MAIEDAPAPRCPACGGDLPVAPYEKTVTCTYCSAQHANTACLALESEVLVASPFGYELRRVTRCEGPTAIGLAGRDGLLHVDDLIPVVRVTGPLAEHVEVFRRGNAAWVRTWTASSLRDGRVKVKHLQRDQGRAPPGPRRHRGRRGVRRVQGAANMSGAPPCGK